MVTVTTTVNLLLQRATRERIIPERVNLMSNERWLNLRISEDMYEAMRRIAMRHCQDVEDYAKDMLLEGCLIALTDLTGEIEKPKGELQCLKK